MGSLPSHPELLDWLAADFRDQDNGSLKRLHRRIVTSAAYRQASSSDERASSIDADNRLMWRMSRRRLDAESVRDAVLAASGSLDCKMGGPSVQQFKLSPGVHVTPVVDYTAYDWSSPGGGRRCVYRFLFRTLPDPFLELLDAADPSQLTDTRGESLSPLQALALLHNAFMRHFSQRMAADLEHSAANLDGRIELAFRRIYGRNPCSLERAGWCEFAAKHGLPATCLALFNTSEFLYLD
jgi:hypothetical protein